MGPTSQTMQAMYYDAYGGPEVLRHGELPRPKLPPASVLIRVRAASVNPVDWKVMAGKLDPMLDVHFPVVPGWDVAGTVEAVGFDTPEFSPGDEVYAYGRRDSVGGGTFAEFTALPAAMVARKPERLSWEEAASLPLTGMTAQRVLDILAPEEGETLLVHNGSGGVGRMAIQQGVHRGLRVLATASARHHDDLRALGAEPLEYGDGLVHEVRSLAPQGVDVVADLVGGVLEQTTAVLRAGGRHASIADPAAADRGGSYVWVRPDARELDRLSLLVEDGALQVHLAATYPMERAADAFRHSMEGRAGGKIALSGFTGGAAGEGE